MARPPPARQREAILGIDFGTSYTAAATLIDGKVQFVMDDGEPMFPTIVHMPMRGDPEIGRRAALRLIADPVNTISSIKRLLGRVVTDKEIRALDQGVGYRIRPGQQNLVAIEIRKQVYACEQIAAMVLQHVRKLAEHRFGANVSKAVVGVPVAAPPSYVAALRRAARLAQIDIVQVVPEPIAGALALGMHQRPAQRRLAVCDFGGGTFDATLIEQNGQMFNPIACSGDPYLGGDDFDERFAAAIAAVIYKKARFEMRNDSVRWQQLLFRCESVKRALSASKEAKLIMKDAYIINGKRANIDVLIDRTWVEAKWAELMQRSQECLMRLLRSANLGTTDVDEVLLVGGTCMVPLVKATFAKFFEFKPLITNEWANLAVVTGLALQTAAHAPIATGTPMLVSKAAAG